jgi:hypothetical protein
MLAFCFGALVGPDTHDILKNLGIQVDWIGVRVIVGVEIVNTTNEDGPELGKVGKI